jgi:hypothetical protein
MIYTLANFGMIGFAVPHGVARKQFGQSCSPRLKLVFKAVVVHLNKER